MVEDPVCKVYVPKGRSLVLHLEGGKKNIFAVPPAWTIIKKRSLKRPTHLPNDRKGSEKG